jgi:hypothetical protein
VAWLGLAWESWYTPWIEVMLEGLGFVERWGGVVVAENRGFSETKVRAQGNRDVKTRTLRLIN